MHSWAFQFMERSELLTPYPAPNLYVHTYIELCVPKVNNRCNRDNLFHAFLPNGSGICSTSRLAYMYELPAGQKVVSSRVAW